MRFYLDACTLIDATEGVGECADLLQALFDVGRRFPGLLVTSQLSLAEVMVKPLKIGDQTLIVSYFGLLSNDLGQQIDVKPISEFVLVGAVYLRAGRPGLKLPDAIHLATADRAGCSHIVTRDNRLAAASSLPVVFGDGEGLKALMEVLLK